MGKYTILIVEDDQRMNQALLHILSKKGYAVESVDSGEKALERIRQTRFDLVVSDLKLPGMDGMEVLKAIKQYDRTILFVIITAYGTVDTAVSAMKQGAEDYILKPFDMEELRLVVEKTLEKRGLFLDNLRLQQQLEKKYTFENIVGTSESMMGVFKTINRVKESRSTVLIRGETGTGKELVARAIHFNSARALKPYLPVNCAALNEDLMASELFGHVKGAFTGAVADKRGLFEAADGGTLFLDEIGDVGQGLQQTFLRALEKGEIQPVGSFQRKIVSVRIIAATNKNLEAMVEQGGFRKDLYYRLNVVTIDLPPLRQRKEDIGLLAAHFLTKYAAQNNKNIRGIAPRALRLLENYSWPGNVRELENIIERATLFELTQEITPDSLPQVVIEPCTVLDPSPFSMETTSLEAVSRRHIVRILEMTNHNKTQASKLLGIDRSTLWRIMNRLKLN
ncbi:sigma-54 dependent DNA-binding response regulator (NtrC-type regulator) [Desulforapulum autotrophicum HRM2]|uniref:Sigma-54 dependent DNA-binding response regulator (NtrC-type regulator) n=1 Tax=Desulforapulum autotrophicum (strain ATCC 43914 / DSM 3382 / VKM B-1955 / HRM2) TaxID=177437 RepID=C0QIQ0_DESAH|nr:sigma-54 dependent transcriptional regulator [Desulforapulum autotrophicum]ACN13690.1 sigma-54 dependent DNA-binding response regulator (NtrC-type regulator) [Desulforapulum autotrophicum HRM2]